MSKDKQKKEKKELHWSLKFIRQLAIYALSILIVFSIFYYGFKKSYENYIMPVNLENENIVEVEIPRGSSLSRISQILYDNELIRNKMVFKLYVDLSNKTSKLKAGKYELSQSMEMAEIMDELLTGNVTVETVKITIIEGWDIRKIAKYLVEEKEFTFTEEEFLDAAMVENFTDYVFLQDIPDERKEKEIGFAPLEGYLFPDTYLVYQDAEPEDIMRKMLDQFYKVYYESVADRALELDMSMDDVVILASIIQKEARINEEFPKISAVFHNRLDKDMKLESDAPVQFLVNEDRWKFTQNELDIDSPFNTYVYPGLPAGPIASPGKLALVSAVNPYEDYMGSDNIYLYFVLKNSKTGEHVFNQTYEDHLKDKELYEDTWDN